MFNPFQPYLGWSAPTEFLCPLNDRRVRRPSWPRSAMPAFLRRRMHCKFPPAIRVATGGTTVVPRWSYGWFMAEKKVGDFLILGAVLGHLTWPARPSVRRCGRCFWGWRLVDSILTGRHSSWWVRCQDGSWVIDVIDSHRCIIYMYIYNIICIWYIYISIIYMYI